MRIILELEDKESKDLMKVLSDKVESGSLTHHKELEDVCVVCGQTVDAYIKGTRVCKECWQMMTPDGYKKYVKGGDGA